MVQTVPARELSQRLLPTERLRRSSEFRRVFRRGRCARSTFLRVHYRASGRELSRMGLVVTKRLGNSVQRKRIKRLLREVFRRHKHGLSVPTDVVLVAQREAQSYEVYRLAFERFLREAGGRWPPEASP